MRAPLERGRRGGPRNPAVAWHLLLDRATRGRARSGKSASDPTRGPSSDPAGGASSSTSPTPATSKLGPGEISPLGHRAC